VKTLALDAGWIEGALGEGESHRRLEAKLNGLNWSKHFSKRPKRRWRRLYSSSDGEESEVCETRATKFLA